LETEERKVLVSTDGRVTPESLKTRKIHTHLIQKFRMKVIEIALQNSKIEFTWIKAHAGHHRYDLADQLSKEAATSRDINEGYEGIPKVQC
jgi:ribonuclease HI